MSYSRRLSWAAIQLLLALPAGCAEGGWRSWAFWPSQTEPDTTQYSKYGPSSSQRIAEIRTLATGAAGTPDDAERISSELARRIQSERDAIVRAEIIRSIAAYPTTTATAVLKGGLQDSNTEVRIASCQALGKRQSPESVAALSGALSSDTDIDVRLAAARALGRSGDPAAVAALGVALEDSDPAMQICAVESLREVTHENFGNDVNAWRQYVQRGQPPKDESIAGKARDLFR